jgi:pimeloyl-ACP methyl ester carboxylesterase
MKTLLAALAAAAAMSSSIAATAEKPTVLLVHGAFADSSSWNRVIAILEADDFQVIAVANPLRGVKSDSQYVADVVKDIDAPVVLVGHSYGGSVISEVHAPNVKALVYVAAFAPDTGETAAGLSAKFPGSTLGPALAAPVALASGGKDLYLRQDRFHEQFAADVPASDAAVMAVGQRPVTEAALNEGASDPAWRSTPSWFIYGDQDRNIPPQALAFMAKRANSKHTEVVKGGSHAISVSRPEAVAMLIERAATAL